MESSVATKKAIHTAVPKSGKPKGWIKRAKRIIWVAFAAAVVLPSVYVYIVSIDLFGLFGPMPGYAAVENPENDLSSDLMSADGVSLGRYFLYNNRSQIHYHD